MPPEASRFNSENLPKFRWATFFSEILQSRQGQPVNVLEGADFLHTEIPSGTAPLVNIEYDSKHRGTFKHKGLLTITTGEPEGETVSVDVPTIVWVYRDFDGIVLGFEVVDQKNNRVSVRFV
jgi:hypothetical protein